MEKFWYLCAKMKLVLLRLLNQFKSKILFLFIFYIILIIKKFYFIKLNIINIWNLNECI